MANRIQLRRDTASNWSSVNPILSEGETGLEIDGLGTVSVNKKIGDGVSTWNQLPYESNSSGSSNTGTLAENLSVTTSYAFDWSKDTFLLNMVADTTFTESNLPEAGKTKTISIYMSGDFIPTFPGDWSTNVTGVYDGTVTNLIVVEYIKANTYWVIITQAD